MNQRLPLTKENLPETVAASNAGLPWLGILAREQISLQIKLTPDDLHPELKAVVAGMLGRVEAMVETVCEYQVIDNQAACGIKGNLDETFIFIITEKSRVAMTTNGPIEYLANRPAIADGTDTMLWSVLIQMMDTRTEIEQLPILVGWRLGEDGVKSANAAITEAKRNGNMPCLFVFACEQGDKIGGLMILVTLPSFTIQAAMMQPAGSA